MQITITATADNAADETTFLGGLSAALDAGAAAGVTFTSAEAVTDFNGELNLAPVPPPPPAMPIADAVQAMAVALGPVDTPDDNGNVTMTALQAQKLLATFAQLEDTLDAAGDPTGDPQPVPTAVAL